jgi:tetratricopeptide (TPR) repeat protein
MGSDICGSLKIFRTAIWFLTALSILCLNVDLNAQIINGQTHRADTNGVVTATASDWKEPFKRGLRYQEQRQYEKAIEEYNEALKVGPGLWFITLQLGTAYYELKQYEKAIFYLTQAIKKNPDPPFRISAYQLRSFSYAGIEKYKEAMDDIVKAIELEPKGSVGYYKRGQYYLLAFNQPEKALKDFDTAITFGDRSMEVHYYRGVALKKLGRFQEAVESYSLVLKIDPSHYSGLLNRGSAYLCLEEYDKALEDQNRILRLYPQDIDARLDRVLVYIAKEEFNSALSDLLFAIDRGRKDAWVYLTLADVYYRLGEFEKAAQANEKAMALDGEPFLRPSLYFQKGLFSLTRGSTEEATQAYEHGIKLAVDGHNLQSIELAERDITGASFSKEEAKTVASKITDQLKETGRKIAPVAVTNLGQCHKSRI